MDTKDYWTLPLFRQIDVDRTIRKLSKLHFILHKPTLHLQYEFSLDCVSFYLPYPVVEWNEYFLEIHFSFFIVGT